MLRLGQSGRPLLVAGSICLHLMLSNPGSKWRGCCPTLLLWLLYHCFVLCICWTNEWSIFVCRLQCVASRVQVSINCLPQVLQYLPLLQCILSTAKDCSTHRLFTKLSIVRFLYLRMLLSLWVHLDGICILHRGGDWARLEMLIVSPRTFKTWQSPGHLSSWTTQEPSLSSGLLGQGWILWCP